MRIALIVTDLTPPRRGGISKVATEIARRFGAAGHEVTVLCLPRSAQAFPGAPGVRLEPVRPRLALYREYPVLAFSLSAFRRLLDLHAARPFDVSHAMNFNNFGLTFYRRRMRRAGLAHVSTGFETTGMELRAKWREFRTCPGLHLLGQIAMESFFAPWQRSYLGWADRITTEDVETREGLLGLGLDAGRIRLVPSGIDLAAVDAAPADPAEEARIRALGRPLVLCPGRVDARKGSQYLVRAFVRVLREAPGAHLVLAGGGRGGHIRGVEALVRAEGLAGRVTVTGEVPSLEPWYRACDLVAIPSLSEGIPITLQEALAHRRPVVCSRLQGTHAYAGHLRAVTWAAPGDASDLAAALARALAPCPPEALAEARAFIEGYDWSRVAGAYLAVYREAVAHMGAVRQVP